MKVLIFICSYERFEVLAVFASTMLAQLGALFIIKERYIYIDHPLHIPLLLCKDFLRSRKQGKFKTDFMFILEAEKTAYYFYQ